MAGIRIDEEFKGLLAPLSSEQYDGLEADILAKGCLDAIKLWNGTIIDGHNRYSICTKHDLSFRTEELAFDTRDDVIEWIIRHQLNRRNQTPEQISYFRGKLYEQRKKAEGGRSDRSFGVEKITTPKTAETIAEEYGVTEKTIRNDADFARAIDTIGVEAGQEVKQQILAGDLPITKKDAVTLAKMKPEERKERIQQVIKGNAPAPHVAHNSGNNEWYTPPDYIEAARLVLGVIDLDPASSDVANLTVQAAEYFTIDDNGLAKPWHGCVWLNPPYAGELIGSFVERLITAYVANEVTAAILLVNNATETGWFQLAATQAAAICFPKGRIRYLDSTGRLANTPLQGQAFLYFGSDADVFQSVFKRFGLVVTV